MDTVKRVEAGFAVPDICRELGISSATFYKWRAKYGGMDLSMMSRMKALDDGRTFRLFNVIDDFNREAIGMEDNFSLPSEQVIREFKQIISWRGKPQVMRCENGPEHISAAIQNWATDWGIKPLQRSGGGLTTTTVETWPWADSLQNSGWHCCVTSLLLRPLQKGTITTA